MRHETSTQRESAHRGEGPTAVRRTPLLVGTLAAALGVAACSPPTQLGPIRGNGRIEGDDVRVSAKIPGRLERVTVREGDHVESGQLLAELSSEETSAQLRQARAGVSAAQAALQQTRTRVEVLEHHAATALSDYVRMKALFDAGAAPARDVDTAENTLGEVQGQLQIAKAQVEQAQASVQERRAAVDGVAIRAADSRVASPLTGTVLHRLVERGEVVQAGQPLMVLVDLHQLYVRAYIAEDRVGRIQLGNPVRVTVDAFPDRAFEGTVTEIAERAEFTPRDIHMPDERTQLVFAVRVRLDNSEGLLKPGMLADVEVVIQQAGGDAR